MQQEPLFKDMLDGHLTPLDAPVPITQQLSQSLDRLEVAMIRQHKDWAHHVYEEIRVMRMQLSLLRHTLGDRDGAQG